MKTPHFWRKRGALAEFLAPLSVLWFLYMRLRGLLHRKPPVIFSVPVIVLGNATAGGAGKTPAAIMLADLLARHGWKDIAFVSSGYGGSLRGPARVRSGEHIADEVGDEPLLLALHAPCWAGGRRADAILAAIKDGAHLVICDDGLQDLSFRPSLSILVVDGRFGFGNGYIMPAGPLRDRLDKTFARADLALLIGEDTSSALDALPASLPVEQANLVPLRHPRDFAGKKYVAFAGLAYPEKFFDTLRGMDVDLCETISFPDHYPYRDKDIAALREIARAKEAALITTEKDAVRLPEKSRQEIETLPVALRAADEPSLYQRILGHIKK